MARTCFGAEKLADVLARCKRARVSKKVQIAVPFVRPQYRGGEYSMRRGVITGIHASSRNLLVRWDNGQSEQDSDYRAVYLRPLSAEDEQAYLTAKKQEHEAERVIHALDKHYGFMGRTVAEHAITEAENAEMEKENGDRVEFG